MADPDINTPLSTLLELSEAREEVATERGKR